MFASLWTIPNGAVFTWINENVTLITLLKSNFDSVLSGKREMKKKKQNGESTAFEKPLLFAHLEKMRNQKSRIITFHWKFNEKQTFQYNKHPEIYFINILERGDRQRMQTDTQRKKTN